MERQPRSFRYLSCSTVYSGMLPEVILQRNYTSKDVNQFIFPSPSGCGSNKSLEPLISYCIKCEFSWVAHTCPVMANIRDSRKLAAKSFTLLRFSSMYRGPGVRFRHQQLTLALGRIQWLVLFQAVVGFLKNSVHCKRTKPLKWFSLRKL